MGGVEQVPIRAVIGIGSDRIETPYVLSFNVHRRRGQPSTFDASVKVKGSISGGGLPSGGISISAGGGGALNLIFTGIIKGAKITPCWDDPSYVIITLTGEDALSVLKGKKYTRRTSGMKGSAFCLITSVTRAGLKSGKFANSSDASFVLEPGDVSTNIPGLSQSAPASLGGISFPKAEGSDLKNNLGVKVTGTLVR